MQTLLAIDTSSEACSVALGVGAEIREQHTVAPLEHAERLLPAVNSLLAEAGIRLGDLDAIAFGQGPGSFTSLRIGIGVVQGLAWGADVPVIPVSSLAAAAQAALAAEAALSPAIFQQSAGSHQILVALDARMSEVFHCRFAISPEGLVEALESERVSPPSAVTFPDAAWVLGAGNGFERYPVLRDLGTRLNNLRPGILPSAAAVITLAQHWLLSHSPLPAVAAQPVYVRNQVADKPRGL